MFLQMLHHTVQCIMANNELHCDCGMLRQSALKMRDSDEHHVERGYALRGSSSVWDSVRYAKIGIPALSFVTVIF